MSRQAAAGAAGPPAPALSMAQSTAVAELPVDGVGLLRAELIKRLAYAESKQLEFPALPAGRPGPHVLPKPINL